MSQRNSVGIKSNFVFKGVVVLLLFIGTTKLTQAQSASSSSTQFAPKQSCRSTNRTLGTSTPTLRKRNDLVG